MSIIIKPSIGRQVWFRGMPWGYFDPAQPPGSIPENPLRLDANQPMAATIVYVHNDFIVNLDVIDHAGNHWPMQSVTLVQGGETKGPYAVYAEWMPYQIGKAKPSPVMSDLFVGTPQPMTMYGDYPSQQRVPDVMPSPNGWPNRGPVNTTQASEVLSGTGQLSARSA